MSFSDAPGTLWPNRNLLSWTDEQQTFLTISQGLQVSSYLIMVLFIYSLIYSTKQKCAKTVIFKISQLSVTVKDQTLSHTEYKTMYSYWETVGFKWMYRVQFNSAFWSFMEFLSSGCIFKAQWGYKAFTITKSVRGITQSFTTTHAAVWFTPSVLLSLYSPEGSQHYRAFYYWKIH